MAKENKGLGRGLSAMFDINDIDLPETEQPSDNPVKVTLKTEKAVPAEKRKNSRRKSIFSILTPTMNSPVKTLKKAPYTNWLNPYGHTGSFSLLC